MQIHHYLSGILFWVLCTGLLPVQADTHIALVGATRLPRELAVLDLAESMLATESGLVLVDRHQVAELLAEQNLSRLGVLQEQHAIRVGQIFNVALFAVLEATEKDDVLWYANVFDANSGEMLIKTPIPVDKELAVSAEAMTHIVKMAAEKLLVPKSERKPITIMAIASR